MCGAVCQGPTVEAVSSSARFLGPVSSGRISFGSVSVLVSHVFFPFFGLFLIKRPVLLQLPGPLGRVPADSSGLRARPSQVQTSKVEKSTHEISRKIDLAAVDEGRMVHRNGREQLLEPGFDRNGRERLRELGVDRTDRSGHQTIICARNAPATSWRGPTGTRAATSSPRPWRSRRCRPGTWRDRRRRGRR